VIVEIEDFTGVGITPLPSGGITGHTQIATWTPDGTGLTGTVSWGPSLGTEHGDDGVVGGFPDVSDIPDAAVLEAYECIIECSADSTFPILARVVTIGSGADGTVTITLTPGINGGDGGKQVQVILAATNNAPLSVANATPNGYLLTVTLGTDGAGAADPTKNTATLVAAAITAFSATGDEAWTLDPPPFATAVASGTGATAVGLKAPTNFSAGYGFARTHSSWTPPGTLVEIPAVNGGYRWVTASVYPHKSWEAWSGAERWGTQFAAQSPVIDLSSKAALAASFVSWKYIIMGSPLDGTFAGDGSVTVTRFTLRVTYSVSEVTLGVEAGLPQVAVGPVPSTVSLLATLHGDIDGDLSYSWEFEDGPGFDVTVTSPNTLATNVIFGTFVPGDYLFRIYVTITHLDTLIQFTVDDDVVITMKKAAPPSVSSGNIRLGVYE